MSISYPQVESKTPLRNRILWSRCVFPVCYNRAVFETYPGCNTFGVIAYMKIDRIIKKVALFILLTSAEGGGSSAAAGMAAAFSAFYEEYMPRVFGYISYRVNDRQTAEDLTSSVFEKALGAFKSYNPERAAMSTWVFAIARNTLIDHFRAASTHQSVAIDEDMDFADENCDPETDLLKSEEGRKLRKLVESLTQDERGIIALKFGAGLTNREIARTTGLSESNVGVIIFRTVRKLRDRFGEEGKGG
jgi:RNA polymerase sigma factor (sigma-70 family)